MVGIIFVLGLIGLAVYSVCTDSARNSKIEKEVLRNGSIADHIRKSMK